MRRIGPLAVGHHQPAVVADDDLRADGGDRLLARSGRSHWSTSSNSAVRSSPSILPGIVRPRNERAVGATSCVEAYQSMSSPAFSPLGCRIRYGTSYDSRCEVGAAAARGSRARRARGRGRRARTRPCRPGTSSSSLPSSSSTASTWSHVRLAHSVDVLVGELELHEPAVRAARGRRPPPGRAGRRTAARRTASTGSNGSTPTKKARRVLHLAQRLRCPARNVRLVASVSRANDFSSSSSIPAGSVSPGDAATAVPPGARTSSKRGPGRAGCRSRRSSRRRACAVRLHQQRLVVPDRVEAGHGGKPVEPPPVAEREGAHAGHERAPRRTAPASTPGARGRSAATSRSGRRGSACSAGAPSSNAFTWSARTSGSTTSSAPRARSSPSCAGRRRRARRASRARRRPRRSRRRGAAGCGG